MSWMNEMRLNTVHTGSPFSYVVVINHAAALRWLATRKAPIEAKLDGNQAG